MVLYFILVIQDFFFYYGSYEVASGILCDGLYKIDLDLNYPFSHHEFATIGSKRVNDELSSILWHRHLGHITRARKKGATRNKGLLEIIHTDICGPFTSAILGGYKYFITFIDHFSRYGYILLIQEKSEALDMFKNL